MYEHEHVNHQSCVAINNRGNSLFVDAKTPSALLVASLTSSVISHVNLPRIQSSFRTGCNLPDLAGSLTHGGSLRAQSLSRNGNGLPDFLAVDTVPYICIA